MLHYQRCTLLFLAVRKNALKNVKATWLVFHAQNLQAQLRRMYLSIPIDLVGHCIRYTNFKVFSHSNFPVYGENPRTYTKHISERTRTFAHFKQCDVSHLSPQKHTHYWTTIIDIMLKITIEGLLAKQLLWFCYGQFFFFFLPWRFLTKNTTFKNIFFQFPVNSPNYVLPS